MRIPLACAVLLSLGTPVLAAQSGGGTVVIAATREAVSPIPTLWANDQVNREVSDLMFLRLLDLGPALRTGDEKGYQPRLASRWSRRDSLTLVFDLDPRARWQDGERVTSADVVFAMNRARDPRLTPQLATLLRRITSVEAEGDGRVVIRFSTVYAEQLYDAVFHAPPLPSHLLAGVPPESLAHSPFTEHPVGNGPYRLTRRLPGRQLELTAWDDFFFGRPGIHRVIFLLAKDAEARVNLLLDGTADVLENVYSYPNPARLEHLPAFLYYPVPGLQISYATLNYRDPADTSRPNPILSDPEVRRALVMALDREGIARRAYGPNTIAPSAPVSGIVGRAVDAPRGIQFDPERARKLLATRGWTDHDGDGVRDKDGKKLSLVFNVPAPVAARVQMATEMQEQLRQVGVELKIQLLDIAVFVERRKAGNFDLEFYGVTQDPTPSGLVQTWTCTASRENNVGHYCDPTVDSLLQAGIISRKGGGKEFHAAVERIAQDVPAIFMTATVPSHAVHRRLTNVSIRPESAWGDLWRWSIRPGQQLERDRQ